MNRAVLDRIAFDISKNSNTTDSERLQLLTVIWDKNVDELVSMAKNINVPISLDDYLQLLDTDYLTDRAAQNKFIAQYLNIKGIICTPTEVDSYNENIRVALMREASSVCDKL